MQHVKNFDGFERDFLKFAEQQGIPVDKKSVVGLYQFPCSGIDETEWYKS
ncbi:MAG: hypothetical protein CM15mV84_300 [uncultured marine virus]|nr:MAG: hypothetical protein CM15mV84_300 [uncultured marine virus]